MIARDIAPFVMKAAGAYPAVTIMGPRQSGKTTLAKGLFPKHRYLNLEAADVLEAAQGDPRAFLRHGEEPLIIDEVQRFPAILTYVQEFADARKQKGQFVLTGSHQPELGAAVCESLAGRTGVCELMPLSLHELAGAGLAPAGRDEAIWRGFMPRLFDDAIEPTMLYRDYFQTYIQRDVRRLLNVQDLGTFTTFVRLLAGRVGQLLNKESLARDAGVSVPTVTKWLNLLEASYVIYRLRPYYENLGKRQTKACKVYFTETGLAAHLIGIREAPQVAVHPLVGGLFENMVVMEALKSRLNRGMDADMWFYRNSSGSVEVDLIVEGGGKLHLREIKSAATFSGKMGKGMRAFADAAANVADAIVVYSGQSIDGIAANFAASQEYMA